jgi:two-component system chemotaxis response regulator CheB
MPLMDGVTFLKKIMTLRPMPVVMISTLTRAGADTTLAALEIGAVDFIEKPNGVADKLAQMSAEICAKVKNAAHARFNRSPRPTTRVRRAAVKSARDRIVAIGASTGGVEALKVVLEGFPAECPPIVITQHMPPRFTAAFAQRLNGECAITVSEAVHNEPIEPNHAYIAPGALHLEIVRRGGKFYTSLNENPPVSGHRPSVDVLFRSVASECKANAVGVILTGMGKDGSQGLLTMRQAGAATIGQDQASSLIYGMPRVAFEIGAVQRQYALNKITDAILEASAVPEKLAV